MLRLLWYALIGAYFLVSPPGVAGIALRSWLGAQVALGGRIPTQLGAESFTAGGTAWSAPGWLGALVTWWTLQHFGVLALKILELLAVFAVLAAVEYRTRRRGGSAASGLLAMVLASLLLGDTLHVGGGGADWLGAAALSVAMMLRGARALLAVISIAALWSNCSSDGVLAPIVVALVGFDEAVVPWAWYACAVLGAGAAVLATPAGLLLVRESFDVVRLDLDLLQGDRTVVEAAPVAPSLDAPIAYRLGLPPLLAAAVCFSYRLRPSTQEALCLLVCTLLAFANGRFLPLLGILCAPAIAAGIARGYATVIARLPRYARMGACAAAVLVAGTLLRGQAVAAAAALDSEAKASALLESLSVDGRSHRVFCGDVDVCDLALRYAPRSSVFLDGRLEAYPAQIVRDENVVRYAHPGWPQVLRARRIDVILLGRDAPLVSLALLHGWRIADVAGDMLLLRLGSGT